jgi:hypothetical protein
MDYEVENEWRKELPCIFFVLKNERQMERVLENSFVTYLYFPSKYQIQKILINNLYLKAQWNLFA